MVLYKQIDEHLSVYSKCHVTRINFCISFGLLEYIKHKKYRTSVL